jgi:hypothetical protein
MMVAAQVAQAVVMAEAALVDILVMAEMEVVVVPVVVAVAAALEAAAV